MFLLYNWSHFNGLNGPASLALGDLNHLWKKIWFDKKSVQQKIELDWILNDFNTFDLNDTLP